MIMAGAVHVLQCPRGKLAATCMTGTRFEHLSHILRHLVHGSTLQPGARSGCLLKKTMHSLRMNKLKRLASHCNLVSCVLHACSETRVGGPK